MSGAGPPARLGVLGGMGPLGIRREVPGEAGTVLPVIDSTAALVDIALTHLLGPAALPNRAAEGPGHRNGCFPLATFLPFSQHDESRNDTVFISRHLPLSPGRCRHRSRDPTKWEGPT